MPMRFVVLLAILASLAMVALSVYLPLGGRETGDISNEYYTAITPAGWAFSIWSLIYSGLLAWGVYQVLPSQTEKPRWIRVRPWVLAVAGANFLWLPAWHYEQLWLALAIIFVYLIALLGALEALRGEEGPGTGIDYVLGYGLLAVYAGWLTTATVVNASVCALAAGVGGSEQLWGAGVLLVSIGLYAFLSRLIASAAYPAVLAWAFFAIAWAHPHQILIATTAVGGVTVGLLLAVRMLFKRTLPEPKTT